MPVKSENSASFNSGFAANANGCVISIQVKCEHPAGDKWYKKRQNYKNTQQTGAFTWMTISWFFDG